MEISEFPLIVESYKILRGQIQILKYFSNLILENVPVYFIFWGTKGNLYLFTLYLGVQKETCTC